ncbi:class II aldolase/adducin family protein [Sphingomonas sp. MG17]|uniref:Class II aldolase/adducin family protein n=1 Tax=Sphingomonas tagetis TaxID=2949092 RepID=A0A9X2HPD2_9SPHN|nr:class II aldolase/adducin family protein [Sphingomonas tagetis]MCP3732126.1 class II aldolase/adducin family protein [Sphingomonas tagetis]
MSHSMPRLVRRGAAASTPSEMSRDEWQARVDLAACYRLIAHFGLNELTYNHISLRIPGDREEILINSFGLMFEEVCASNLVKIDLYGRILNDPVGNGINEAGYVIHGAIHEARPDIACVIHNHTPAGMAVSAQRHGLLPLSQTAMLFHGQIGYHDYEGIAISMDERARLVENLGNGVAMILRNHGLLSTGRSVAEAFNAMVYLERACEAQVKALAAGWDNLCFPATEAIEMTAQVYRENSYAAAERDWPTLRRMVDRLDESYKN